jgi:hypothetical protein
MSDGPRPILDMPPRSAPRRMMLEPLFFFFCLFLIGSLLFSL